MVFRNRIGGESRMKFSENNNSSIIDELFESKCTEYEIFIDSKNEEGRNLSIINELLDSIENCGKKEIPEKVRKEIKKKCDDLDRAISSELRFWEMKFYKLGFIDGMRMTEDLKSETKKSANI